MKVTAVEPVEDGVTSPQQVQLLPWHPSGGMCTAAVQAPEVLAMSHGGATTMYGCECSTVHCPACTGREALSLSCSQEEAAPDFDWRREGVQAIQAVAQLQACRPFMEAVRESQVRLAPGMQALLQQCAADLCQLCARGVRTDADRACSGTGTWPRQAATKPGMNQQARQPARRPPSAEPWARVAA